MHFIPQEQTIIMMCCKGFITIHEMLTLNKALTKLLSVQIIIHGQQGPYLP